MRAGQIELGLAEVCPFTGESEFGDVSGVKELLADIEGSSSRVCDHPAHLQKLLCGLVFDDQGKVITYRRMLSDLDENALREMAAATGGRYFRADDERTVKNAFAAIDAAQKIEFQAKSYLLSTELFIWFAAPGAAVLLLGALLARPFNRQEVAA